MGRTTQLRIGDIAQRAGVSTRALRYYEEQGLLAPERTPSGQRSYAESAVERVQMIQGFFTAGLASRTIRQLLPCVDTGHGSPEALALLPPSATASPPPSKSSLPRATPSTGSWPSPTNPPPSTARPCASPSD